MVYKKQYIKIFINVFPPLIYTENQRVTKTFPISKSQKRTAIVNHCD